MKKNFEYKNILLEKLIPYPYQSRLNEEVGIDNLGESIRQNGLLHPIDVWDISDDKMMIIDGHRRVLAFKKIGCIEIPAKIYYNLTDSAAAQIHLAEDDTLKPLSKIEKALKYQKMLTDGKFTLEELSKLIKASTTSICETLSLLKIPDKHQDKLNNDLTYSDAVELVKLLPKTRWDDDDLNDNIDRKGEFEILIKKVIKNKQPRQETRKLVRLINSKEWFKLPTELKSLLLNNTHFYTEFKEFALMPEKLVSAEEWPEIKNFTVDDSIKIARYIANRMIPYCAINEKEHLTKISKYIINLARKKADKGQANVITGKSLSFYFEKFEDLYTKLQEHKMNFNIIKDVENNFIDKVNNGITSLMSELESFKNSLLKLQQKNSFKKEV